MVSPRSHSHIWTFPLVTVVRAGAGAPWEGELSLLEAPPCWVALTPPTPGTTSLWSSCCRKVSRESSLQPRGSRLPTALMTWALRTCSGATSANPHPKDLICNTPSSAPCQTLLPVTKYPAGSHPCKEGLTMAHGLMEHSHTRRSIRGGPLLLI